VIKEKNYNKLTLGRFIINYLTYFFIRQTHSAHRKNDFAKVLKNLVRYRSENNFIRPLK